MNKFSFHTIKEMDNVSKAGFCIIFFKESGKYHDVVYCTADVSDDVDSFKFNEAVRKFVKNYSNYRNVSAVIIAGENSIVVPQLISTAERR